MTTTPAGELPPLPKPTERGEQMHDFPPTLFTADQLRAYGELCATERDWAWTLALTKALGPDSRLPCPIAPDADAFRKLFAALAAQEQQQPAISWQDPAPNAAPPLVPSPSVTLQVGVGTDKPRDHSLTAVSPEVLHGALAAQAQVAVPLTISCSQCGREFGPGQRGFSHCDNHIGMAPL